MPQDDDKLLEPVYKEEQRYDIEAKKLEAQSLKYNEKMHNYLPTISINNSLKKQEYLHYDAIYNDKLNNQLSLQINFPNFDFEKISKDKEASQLETLALNKEIEYKEKSLTNSIITSTINNIQNSVSMSLRLCLSDLYDSDVL